MKVPSSLLKAMLVTATLGSTVGCASMQPHKSVGESVIAQKVCVAHVTKDNGQLPNDFRDFPGCCMG